MSHVAHHAATAFRVQSFSYVANKSTNFSNAQIQFKDLLREAPTNIVRFDPNILYI